MAKSIQSKKRWIEKSTDQLENIAMRISLLLIIKYYRDEGGIHGYDIGRVLYQTTEGMIAGSNATYYAILRRLEQDELLTSITKHKENRSRKYYKLTEDGDKALITLLQLWKSYDYSLEQLQNISIGR